MINFLYTYSLELACCFFIMTALANSFCDAINFSGAMKRKGYNNLWHWIKHGIDRESLALAGFFSYNTIKEQIKNDFWHYTTDFLILAFVFIASFFIWQINYRIWKRYFKRKCYDQFL